MEKNVVLNPPGMISFILKIASTFLSASTMSKVMMREREKKHTHFFVKVALCKGNTLTGRVEECPFASRRFKKEDLPSFMGGLCTCDGKGCIQNVSNDLRTRKEMLSE